jgi:hypothetical protein
MPSHAPAARSASAHRANTLQRGRCRRDGAIHHTDCTQRHRRHAVISEGAHGACMAGSPASAAPQLCARAHACKPGERGVHNNAGGTGAERVRNVGAVRWAWRAAPRADAPHGGRTNLVLRLQQFITKTAVCTHGRRHNVRHGELPTHRIRAQASHDFLLNLVDAVEDIPNEAKTEDERKSYRFGPKVSSWPNILTVNPY